MLEDREPDYSLYSLDELEETYARIDKEAYPQRAAKLAILIAERREARSDEPAPSRLASRGERFAAASIDGVIGLLISFSALLFFTIPIDVNATESQLISDMTGFIVKVSLYSLVGFIVVHGYTLFYDGQTIGKRFLNIRIEDIHGNIASFVSIVFVRYLVFALLPLIPVIGSFLQLANILFIFREDHRCLHDHAAKTQVMRVPDDNFHP